MLNKLLITLTALFIFTSAPIDSVQASSLIISNAYIPDAPPMVKVMAAYMTIENTSDKTITINTYSSDTFGKVELHETIMKDGMMSMIQPDKLVIKARSKVELKPGGKHLMLFARKRNLKLNDKLTITLRSDQSQHRAQISVK